MRLPCVALPSLQFWAGDFTVSAAPSIYLGKIASKGQVDPNVLDGYLGTHWIDVAATRNDDFNAFIVSRAIMLLDAIATAMGKPISGRDGEEVINNFGKALIH